MVMHAINVCQWVCFYTTLYGKELQMRNKLFNTAANVGYIGLNAIWQLQKDTQHFNK